MLYKWKRASDLTYNIYDVPIFSVHDTSFRSYEINKNILSACINNMQNNQEFGHLAPIHTYHHGSEKMNKRVGFLANPKLVNHKNVSWTVVCDFIGIKEEDFKEIQDGVYSYRSVEAHVDIEKEINSRINSLALLVDEAPFFNYTMLVLEDSETIDRESYTVKDLVQNAEEQFSFAKNIDNIITVYKKFNSLEEVYMPEKEEEKKKKEEEVKNEASDKEEKKEEKPKEKEDFAGKVYKALEKIISMLSPKEEKSKEEKKEEKPKEEKNSALLEKAMRYKEAGYTLEDSILLAEKLQSVILPQIQKKQDFYEADNKTNKQIEEDYNWSQSKNTFQGTKEAYIKYMTENAHEVCPEQFSFDEKRGISVRRIN